MSQNTDLKTENCIVTKPRYAGPSRDGRTNRWKITCPCCGNTFEPNTTMLSTQVVDCAKCMAEMKADYNNEIVYVYSIEK